MTCNQGAADLAAPLPRCEHGWPPDECPTQNVVTATDDNFWWHIGKVLSFAALAERTDKGHAIDIARSIRYVDLVKKVNP